MEPQCPLCGRAIAERGTEVLEMQPGSIWRTNRAKSSTTQSASRGSGRGSEEKNNGSINYCLSAGLDRDVVDGVPALLSLASGKATSLPGVIA